MAVRVHSVELFVCELCLVGNGGVCRVPGCAFWGKEAPQFRNIEYRLRRYAQYV